MSGGKLLNEIKKILGDTSELAGDTPDAKSHRILDYVREIKEDTGTIVEEGKGLSTNDFTTEEKQKLTNIQAGAQVNVIESVKVNNSPLPVSEKGVNIDLSGYALKTDVTGAMIIKGTVNTYAELPESPAVGDAYGVTTADPSHGIEAGEIVLWNGSEWVDMGGTIDLSAYQTKASLDSAVSGLGYMKTTDADAKYQTIAGMTSYMKVADYPEATDEEIDALFE